MGGETKTKQYAVLPLPPKVATKGFSGGAESFSEVVKAVSSKLKSGSHVAAADGSPALQKAAAFAGSPSLTGVAHLRFLFTPLSAVPKAGLCQQEIDLFRKLVQDGTAKERRSDFVLTAGDNAAESVASVSKTQLRRMNLLRSVSSHPIEHRSLLAAHYLNKSPGLESVLRALAMHRQKASSGLLSPRECFQKPLWKA